MGPIVRGFGVGLLVVGIVGFSPYSGNAIFAQEESNDTNDLRARKLFEEGSAYYEEADYSKAAKAMEESYRLSKRPVLLFNLANTYERSGEYLAAAIRLRTYLAIARPSDSSAIRKRIERLEGRSRAKRAEAEVRLNQGQQLKQLRSHVEKQMQVHYRVQQELSDTQEELRRRVVVATAEDSLQPSRQDDLVSETALAFGSAALLVAGASFSIMARNANSRVDDVCADGTPRVCTDEADSALRSWRRWSLAADMSFGLATIGAGTVAYLFWNHAAKKKRSRSQTVSPLLSSELLGAVVEGRF